jgi:monothiol bacilliredoxin
MGLLKSLFNSSQNKQESNFNWRELTEINDIEALKTLSKDKKVIIFKHSTRCGISRMVLKSFEKKWVDSENGDFYYLDLLRFRDISNAIAHDFEVFHQSPQLIVLENGKVRAHASHYDILNIAI